MFPIGTSATIVACGSSEPEDRYVLPAELWADTNLDEHRRFASESLRKPTRLIAFLAPNADGIAVGFAEASLRFDYVNGCATSPVGFPRRLVRPGCGSPAWYRSRARRGR